MKAAVFRDVDVMETVELPVPDCPEDGILVKVHACGICGSDIRNFHNGLKDDVKDQIMGHEIAGEIVAAGARVETFRAGERVALAPDVSCGTCWYCKRGMVNLCEHHTMLGTHYPGGFAQYLALSRRILEHGFVEKIPDDMPYEHAAFAETAAAVVACQNRIGISMNDTVAIIGDGPVGCLHVEVARARGAGRVILLGRDRLELAQRFQPDVLLDNREPRACMEQVLELTEGRGADFVISAIPSVTVQQQGIEMLRKRGTLVIYGGVPQTQELSALNSNRIHYGELTVTGAFSYPASGLRDALEAIANHKIHAERYLSDTVPLSGIVEGMAAVQRGEALKIMVNPWK